MTAKPIELLQYPAAVSKMLLFLGLCNVYRRFVPNFSALASPLNKKLKKGESLRIKLDDKERKVVDVLKEKLISLPALE